MANKATKLDLKGQQRIETPCIQMLINMKLGPKRNLTSISPMPDFYQAQASAQAYFNMSRDKHTE